MKNIAHTLIVVLALTGAAAATHISTESRLISKPTMAAKATAFPIPTCPPNDPNACGMGGSTALY